LKRASAQYIYYRSFHAEISDLYDATIMSMHNSAQLNVDLYVVTPYGPSQFIYECSIEISVYQDLMTISFEDSRCYLTYEHNVSFTILSDKC